MFACSCFEASGQPAICPDRSLPSSEERLIGQLLENPLEVSAATLKCRQEEWVEMSGIFLHHDPYRNPFFLGMIEGAADSVVNLLSRWSGDRSDQAGRRKGLVGFGYSFAVLTGRSSGQSSNEPHAPKTSLTVSSSVFGASGLCSTETAPHFLAIGKKSTSPH